MRVLRFVLALILMTSAISAENAIKQHINFGTTFSPRGKISFSTEAWKHSFLIDLGKPFHIPAFKICPINTRSINISVCAAKNRLAFAVNAIRTELGHNINDTVKLLEQLLPNTELPSVETKRKRALFPFLGSIIHDITGLSDKEEMEQVQGQINLLKKAFLKELVKMHSEVPRALLFEVNPIHRKTKSTVNISLPPGFDHSDVFKFLHILQTEETFPLIIMINQGLSMHTIFTFADYFIVDGFTRYYILTISAI